MPLAPTLSAVPSVCGRTALLVFARTAPAELAARGWPRQFAPLVDPSPRVRPAAAVVDPHFFIEASAQSWADGELAANLHRQSGCDFGERLRCAVQRVAELGYEQIVIVGGDCPDLASADIAHAAALLQKSDAVLGPDHRGGLYLIGIHAADRHLLDTVVWRRNTDYAQLRSLYAGRRVGLLPVKLDLDSWEDLQLFARLDGGLHRWLARQLAWFAGERARPATLWIDLARQSARARRMTSPPALAA